LLGPNGSGKTTALSMLATLLRPDGGRARVFGHDVVAEPHVVRQLLVTELLERFDLVEDASDRILRHFSGGMRRRLDLAACARPPPTPVLFLDEPTTGLDPRSRAELWKVILGARRAPAPPCCSRRSTSRRPTSSPTHRGDRPRPNRRGRHADRAEAPVSSTGSGRCRSHESLLSPVRC
jgi:ABC-type multidrug transport system ATPase subunit